MKLIALIIVLATCGCNTLEVLLGGQGVACVDDGGCPPGVSCVSGRCGSSIFDDFLRYDGGPAGLQCQIEPRGTRLNGVAGNIIRPGTGYQSVELNVQNTTAGTLSEVQCDEEALAAAFVDFYQHDTSYSVPLAPPSASWLATKFRMQISAAAQSGQILKIILNCSFFSVSICDSNECEPASCDNVTPNAGEARPLNISMEFVLTVQ